MNLMTQKNQIEFTRGHDTRTNPGEDFDRFSLSQLESPGASDRTNGDSAGPALNGKVDSAEVRSNTAGKRKERPEDVAKQGNERSMRRNKLTRDLQL